MYAAHYAFYCKKRGGKHPYFTFCPYLSLEKVHQVFCPELVNSVHFQLLFLIYWFKKSFLFSFRGANIEARDKDNYTPLLVAVAQGNELSVSALLEHDADIRVKESSDKSAIFIAAQENCVDVLQVRRMCKIVCDI